MPGSVIVQALFEATLYGLGGLVTLVRRRCRRRQANRAFTAALRTVAPDGVDRSEPVGADWNLAIAAGRGLLIVGGPQQPLRLVPLQTLVAVTVMMNGRALTRIAKGGRATPSPGAAPLGPRGRPVEGILGSRTSREWVADLTLRLLTGAPLLPLIDVPFYAGPLGKPRHAAPRSAIEALDRWFTRLGAEIAEARPGTIRDGPEP